MAELHPSTITHLRPTRGEVIVHRFLATTLARRPDVLISYDRKIGGQQIDFVLYIPQVGVVALEVKDWPLPIILSAGDHHWLVRKSDQPKDERSPYWQAQQCAYRVKERMEQEPRLLHAGGAHVGNVILRVGPVVAFPNIRRADAEQSLLREHFDFDRTIFKDDLDDTDPDRLVAFLDEAIRPRFRIAPLEDQQLDALRHCFFRSDMTLAARPTRAIQHIELTASQRRFARDLGPGPRLIKGIPGSGKTIVLVQQALFKAHLDPDCRRLLFLCFNLTLASYVRALIDENLEADRRDRIVIEPFFELCGKLLGESIAHEGQPAAYYQEVTRRALESATERFDSLIIDEGQDFTADMYRVALALMRTGRDDVKIAYDPAQDLFGRLAGFTFSSVGLDVRGKRTTVLARSHRCSQRILEFAYGLLGRQPEAVDSETGQQVLFPEDLGHEGEHQPDATGFKTRKAVIQRVVQQAKSLLDDAVPAAEIGILYTRDLQEASQARGLSLELRDALAAVGIPVEWFSESSEHKLRFDITHDSVKLGSVYSSKGLDFETVFLLDTAGDCQALTNTRKRPTPESRHARIRLFVGATRARERLHLVSLMPMDPGPAPGIRPASPN